MEPSELGTEPIRVRVGSPSRRGRPSSRTPSEITEDDGGIPRRQLPERVVIPRSRSPTIVRVPPEAPSIERTPSAGRVRREETQRRPHESPHRGMVSGNPDYCGR